MAESTLTAEALADIVILMEMAIGGLTDARAINADGKTKLSELGGAWADPVWISHVRAAWSRTVKRVGIEIPFPEIMVLPAIDAYALVGTVVGQVDTATGAVTGASTPTSMIMRHYDPVVSRPVSTAQLIGIGAAGAAGGALLHQLLRGSRS